MTTVMKIDRIKKDKNVRFVVLLLLATTIFSAVLAWMQAGMRKEVAPSDIRTTSSSLKGGPSAATGKFERLSFDTLKSWIYVPGKTGIPEKIKKFDGQNVEMVGYMMPLGDYKNMTEFLLVPSLW